MVRHTAARSTPQDRHRRTSGDAATRREAAADTREAAADARETAADTRESDADTRDAATVEREQAAQYARSLIEASLDPLVTISPEGKITDVNAATTKVTGLDREALVGTDFSDYFTEPRRARDGYQKAFAQGTVTDYLLTIRHQSGSLVDVMYNASVYKDSRGNVLGVFAAARDVTAQRRAEAELLEQRAHELERLAELERFQRFVVGRELKMIELKREIEELRRRLPDDAEPD